jgi:uncharacterized sulfatase
LIGKAKAGSRNETSVFAAFDLGPSMLSIAGVTKPADIAFDGEDLAPVLLGYSEASRRAPIFWRRPPDRKNWLPHIAESQPDLTVREGNWKLLCDYDGLNPILYDMSTDIAEAHDCASDHPEIVERLKSKVLAWHASMPADNGPQIPAEKPKGKGKK